MLTRKNWIRLGIVAAVATGLLAAQGLRSRFGGPFGGHHERFREFIATYLDLTDSQKEKAKAIFEAARESAQPVVQQLRQNREAMRTAIQGGASDAELQQIADQVGGQVAQVAGIWAKSAAKFYAILTPEQKAKAEKLHAMFRERWQRRIEP